MADSGNPRSVFVAADDDTMQRALSGNRAGSAAWTVMDLSAAVTRRPDPGAIVVVDHEDATAQLGAVAALRESGFAGPILILGDAGAARLPQDEPVARPVRLGTLLARIESHWVTEADAQVVTLGPYEFVPAAQILRDVATGAVIRLTELERKLLDYLVEAGGGLIDRDQLLENVWGYNVGADTHTVETHIWRLRQKIETDDPESRFLVTEAGGYRLLLAGSVQAG